MQLFEKIPNNVNLSQDKRLLRALDAFAISPADFKLPVIA